MPFIDNLPSKSQIFEHWKDRLGELGFFIDWGEPSCWACGFGYDVKYDVRGRVGWADILSKWNKIPLQRCHIIPRSLGGSDEPENLFLMCRECHDLASNTDVPELFFEWARAQSAFGREWAKAQAALGAFDVDETKLGDLHELMQSDDFKKWASDKIGLHRPQSNYAPRSSRLTFSTIIGLVVQYHRMNQK